MTALRRLVARRHPAALLCAVALLLKLIVPAGYMIAGQHGRITVTLCPGVAPTALSMAMPGMHGGLPDHGRDQGRAEMPCAFEGMSAQALGTVGAIAPVIVVAVAMAFGIAASVWPALPQPPQPRPPSRAPPALI